MDWRGRRKGHAEWRRQGAFSFEPDLNKKIIVRRNNASYDSGLKHDDLMVIYTEGATRAIYFDTEGHVIRYNVSVPSDIAWFSSRTGRRPDQNIGYLIGSTAER